MNKYTTLGCGDGWPSPDKRHTGYNTGVCVCVCVCDARGGLEGHGYIEVYDVYIHGYVYVYSMSMGRH